MRRRLPALALTAALGATALVAPAARAAAAPRPVPSFVAELGSALRLGWALFWGDSDSPRRFPKESVALEYGAGVDPNGRCAPPLCAPPPEPTTAGSDRGR